jgi:hypothetical protein
MKGWPDVFRSDHRPSKRGSEMIERGRERERMEGKEGRRKMLER